MNAEPSLEPEDLAKGRIGELLNGKWRLEKLLGVGGMAAVYAARHENNDRNAAIKVLHLEASHNQEVKRRFLREGYIANKVKHPGAVAVLDDGVTEDGAAYIVMELCQGETLQEHLDHHGLADEATVLRWVDGLLDVLSLAHKEGIVHRDLKPDNVFVLQEGGVKILDFGIARIRGGLSDLKTQAGLVLGTPAFMPPEQARGQSSRVDGRADLWAIGAIMLAALTGKRVHTAKSPQESLFLAMTEVAKSMIDLAPEISPKVAAIIDKALEFEPEARWDDAASMQAAVRAVLAAFSRDPTILAHAAPKPPVWPPAPVVPGPPIAPRASLPHIEVAKPAPPESGMRLPAAPAPSPKAEAPTKIEAVATPEPQPITSTPISNHPPPVHLQNEARSLEAGSPLLETNRRRGPLRVLALVALLVAASFGAAFLIQHDTELRVQLGLESAVVPVPPPVVEPPPLPSVPEAAVAAEVPADAASAVTEQGADEVADAGVTLVADAGAKNVTAQRPKAPAKKPVPKKPPPKKKRRR